MTVTWPAVLVPRDCSPPELRNAARGGGASFTGVEQRVYSDAGRWEISYTVPVHNRAQQLAWRAMMARLREGEDILMTIFDPMRPSGALGQVQQALLASDAAVRATTVTLYTVNLALEAGVHFTVGSRLYLIKQVVSVVPGASIPAWLATDTAWTDAGTWADDPLVGLATYVVKITPPLRAAATALSAVEFRDLTCLCVLPSDDGTGDLVLDLGKFGTPSIKLIEA